MLLGAVISGLLHVIILVVLVIGLPRLFPPEEFAAPIPVELVAIEELEIEDAPVPAPEVVEQDRPPPDSPPPSAPPPDAPQQQALLTPPDESPPVPEPEAAPDSLAVPEPLVEPEPERQLFDHVGRCLGPEQDGRRIARQAKHKENQRDDEQHRQECAGCLLGHEADESQRHGTAPAAAGLAMSSRAIGQATAWSSARSCSAGLSDRQLWRAIVHLRA